jgi:NADP-dependent 3-hydroxy acid dehydrogenase YdfG
VGRRAEELEATAARARRSSADVVVYPTDLADPEQAAALHGEIARWGRLDVLVHSAGVMEVGPMDHATLAQFDEQWEVNVRALYSVTKSCLQALGVAQGEVVFVNSSIAVHPRGGLGQYAATEAAVRAIADSLRDEVNERGIRVLSVFPGRTATPRQEWLHEREGRSYDPDRLMQPEDVAASIVSALQLARSAEVTDIHLRPFRKPL